MIIPTWKNPHRKRRTDIKYTDEDYTLYYDIDLSDFADIVMKLKNDEHVTDEENHRYGIYVLTMCIIVLEGPKFKLKPYTEKEEIIEQQYFELLQGIRLYDPDKGKIYSYAYRIAYTAACHYYTNKIEQQRRDDIIAEQVENEYNIYLGNVSDCKVRNVNKDA